MRHRLPLRCSSASTGQRQNVHALLSAAPKTRHFSVRADGENLQAELAKFAKLRGAWWDPTSRAGVGPLHSMNPVRVSFIRDCVLATRSQSSPAAGAAGPLSGLQVLDVGCGGGLLSEALARLGGAVTGIDPAAENIATAKAHARGDPLTRGIIYRVGMVQEMAAAVSMKGGAAAPDAGMAKSASEEAGATRDTIATGSTDPAAGPVERFDLVVSSEVIEHVDSPREFAAALAALVKPGGILFLSTINRTVKSFAVAIVGAECIARLVPVGTHNWRKFVTPEELEEYVQAVESGVSGGAGIRLLRRSGMAYDPVRDKWWFTADERVNYIACYTKAGSGGI